MKYILIYFVTNSHLIFLIGVLSFDVDGGEMFETKPHISPYVDFQAAVFADKAAPRRQKEPQFGHWSPH